MKTRGSEKHAPPVASTGRRKRSPRRRPVLQGWDAIEALIGTVEGPEDWALEHDHYIHGGPKRRATGER